ncbi:dipeptidase PepE [Paraneptunicella aestuarii]|uniref:dipeptidase PepE n=1 Tax=Paraneptunicella aestuarii TaxID=2831148 RepID=UPI001E5F0372|nr:dipeptidase PepE [Paraneptunicella aestuarii]UAA40459.1 dipeptidase PepE [Paraneptunicella aestuarii]
MKLLLLSSSRAGQSGYLETAREAIYQHTSQCKNIVFIPYAGVTINHDEYTAMVQNALPELSIRGIHTWEKPLSAIREADAIFIGGGNTFNLLYSLYRYDLVDAIKEKVQDGALYVGWSAGSNVAGKTIRTTNDMPIIEPPSFTALNLVPFQINPHFTNYQPPGHNGETRTDRLNEFMILNPDTPVLAIPEGTGLLVEQGKYEIIGEGESYVFQNGEQITVSDQAHLQALLP